MSQCNRVDASKLVSVGRTRGIQEGGFDPRAKFTLVNLFLPATYGIQIIGCNTREKLTPVNSSGYIRGGDTDRNKKKCDKEKEIQTSGARATERQGANDIRAK